MRKRALGSTGVEVGEMGLGCMPMSFGYVGEGSDRESVQVIHRALELGVGFFDTADVYGPFANEELVGRALEGRTEGIVVATKVGYMVGPNGGYPLRHDARPERIRREVEESLRRLRREVIDLYYLHRVDPEVPLEESWGAMARLVDAGKVRWLGLSEVGVAELERAWAIHPVTAVQSELSLWTRDHLGTVLPWCEDRGVSFVPFAPLGRGFLTGTIESGRFDPDDFRAGNPRFTEEAVAANRRIVEAVERVARGHGATAAQVALAWVLGRGDVVLPIPGTRRRVHLEENIAAAGLRLTPVDLHELDGIPESVAPRY